MELRLLSRLRFCLNPFETRNSRGRADLIYACVPEESYLRTFETTWKCRDPAILIISVNPQCP